MSLPTTKPYRIVALAGRRTDLTGGVSRFPPENAPAITTHLDRIFRERDVRTLVCSAAAGADLLALVVARELGIRQRVVLPVSVEVFKEESVTDRGPDWARLFDPIISEVRRKGDLVLMNRKHSGVKTFLECNELILDEALRLACEPHTNVVRDDDVLAVVVWEGGSRGGDDITNAFARSSAARGIRVLSVNTLEPNESERFV